MANPGAAPVFAHVKGSGLAACCCLRLLRQAGVPAAARQTAKTGVPVVLLSAQTCRLFSGLFAEPGLFDSGHEISRRIVAWGRGAEPRALPHFAKAIAETDLLDRLWSAMPSHAATDGPAEWSVIAAPEPWTRELEHHFGTRVAHAAPVVLAPDAPGDACWIESVGEGWLFLTSAPQRRAWLLAVGSGFDAVFSESRLVKRQIAEIAGPASAFPSYPKILSPLHGDRWLACGTAAMRFDPICGEGAAHALRESILASAVIRRLAAGDHAEPLLEHYSTRMFSGFLRHIEASKPFYDTGGDSPWWKGERETLAHAEDWTRQRLTPAPARYALRGLELQPLSRL